MLLHPRSSTQVLPNLDSVHEGKYLENFYQQDRMQRNFVERMLLKKKYSIVQIHDQQYVIRGKNRGLQTPRYSEGCATPK